MSNNFESQINRMLEAAREASKRSCEKYYIYDEKSGVSEECEVYERFGNCVKLRRVAQR